MTFLKFTYVLVYIFYFYFVYVLFFINIRYSIFCCGLLNLQNSTSSFKSTQSTKIVLIHLSSTDVVPLCVDFTESTQLYGYSTFYVGFNSVRDLKNLSIAFYYVVIFNHSIFIIIFIYFEPILLFLIFPSFLLCTVNVKLLFLIRLL